MPVASPRTPPKGKSGTFTVAFVHPDLGIGGAERLVVDAALGLRTRGHRVHIYTSHHSPAHCFPETVGPAAVPVTVCGDWLPRSIAGSMHLLCALARHLYLILWLCRQSWSSTSTPDVYVVDQIAVGVPLLRWATGKRVLFYCHFPDKLLTGGQGKGALARAYRVPLDWLEDRGTAAADEMLVNSKFTRAVTAIAFPKLRAASAVVYPGVAAPAADAPPMIDVQWASEGPLVLSINRFERKKVLHLAIAAFKEAAVPDAVLVLAGGYDPLVDENAAVLASLRKQCTALGLEHVTLPPSAYPKPGGTLYLPSTTKPQKPGSSSGTSETGSRPRVVFMPSVPEPLKRGLLARATVLVYTPPYEHFGIVPVEAMRAGVPVVAHASGGPAESVVHLRTGWLCEPESISAASAPSSSPSASPTRGRSPATATSTSPARSASRSVSPGSWPASDDDTDAGDYLLEPARPVDLVAVRATLRDVSRPFDPAHPPFGSAAAWAALMREFARGIRWAAVDVRTGRDRERVRRACVARAEARFGIERFVDGIEAGLMVCMAGASATASAGKRGKVQ
ncbi:hypothetical protein BC828DRAFT_344871 [Blastocladiella britannica]|nr:hypothetical protein BC828DRAFT_344871 [Blastocladiella britannica]